MHRAQTKIVFGSSPCELELALVLGPGESSTRITDLDVDDVDGSTVGIPKSNVNPGAGLAG
jgi:hypothetical protein